MAFVCEPRGSKRSSEADRLLRRIKARMETARKEAENVEVEMNSMPLVGHIGERIFLEGRAKGIRWTLDYLEDLGE